MTDREMAFLRAASNLVEYQEPILAHFEFAAGMSAFDYWIRKRVGRTSAAGQSPSHDPWRYFFHGLEVEAMHRDGRHLRIELGPRGMTNVFTGASVAVHVLDSKPPWPLYTDLSGFLRNSRGFPDGELARKLEQGLLKRGLFARADPELHALRESCSLKSPDGTTRIEIPPELRPDTPEDVFLCERLVLTEDGRREARAV